MRIDSKSALTLAAFIRSALRAIDRIETHVSQFDIDNLSLAELDSLGYSLHNIYNALENCFGQISLSFENDVRDRTRWHRELLEKMFSGYHSLATRRITRKSALNIRGSARLSSLVSTCLRVQTRPSQNSGTLESLVA